MSAIIEVRDLCFTYSKGTPFAHTALDRVSMTVREGEFLGIIGHTGSGKSTLIQQLNGLLEPDSGTVLFRGEDIRKDKKQLRRLRGRVGLVFQYPEYQLFEETVYKDIAFGPSNMGLSGDELNRRVLEAARFTGIGEELLQKSPFDLSGGQKRRAAIAGVIAMEPEVLILDEPTAGLDAAGQREILRNILDYRRERNAAIVMVSHSMEDVAELADRLLVMNHGAVDCEGTPEEIFSREAHLREIGLSVPQVTEIFRLLRERGVDVPANVYTVEQAAQALQALKGGA